MPDPTLSPLTLSDIAKKHGITGVLVIILIISQILNQRSMQEQNCEMQKQLMQIVEKNTEAFQQSAAANARVAEAVQALEDKLNN